MKTCITCRIEKDLSCFSKVGQKYFSSYCKPCDKEKKRNIYLLTKDKISDAQKAKWEIMTPAEKSAIYAKRKRVEVPCSDCGKMQNMRKDAFNSWKGKCKSCCSKYLSKLPHIIAAKRKNGLEFIAKYGKIKSPKIENRPRGEAHYNWRGGITPFRVAIYQSEEYKTWRKGVMARDGYACVSCGINDHKLEADHVLPFAVFTELRFDLSNGRTLCRPCHHKLGARVNQGKVTRWAKFDYMEQNNGTNWVIA